MSESPKDSMDRPPEEFAGSAYVDPEPSRSRSGPELALERDLIQRERLESLITGISAEFIVVEPDRIDAVMGHALQRIAEAIEIDHAYLCRFRGDPPRMRLTHEWCADDRPSAFERIDRVPVACQPWLWSQIRGKELISIACLDDLPAEAASTYRFMRETGANSFLAVPLCSGANLLGFLAFTERAERSWAPERSALLRFVGDIFVNAIERKEKGIALRESENRFRAVVENMPVMMEAFDADGRFVFWNRECERVTGYSAAGIVGNSAALGRMYPDPIDRARVEAEWKEVGGNYRDRERRIRCKDGSERIISWSSCSGEAPLSGWAGWSVGIDVTARHEAQAALSSDIAARQRAEELVRAQRAVLEMIACGKPLDEVLDALCRQVETFVKPSGCSVMLLDEPNGCLRLSSGPSLGADLARELDGLVPGELAGSCGTAAFTGQPVIVPDTSEDPRWEPLRELADRFEIRACWSTPILSDRHDVLGTFAIHHPRPRQAEQQHLKLIESAAHLAGIAIQRERSDSALEVSEAQWRSVVDTAPDCILRLDPEGRILFINRAAGGLAAGDLAVGDLIGQSIFDVSRPEDHEAIRSAIDHVLATGEFASYESEGPGDVAYASRMGPFTEGGRIVGVTSVARDTTERQRADAMRAGQTRVLELLAAGRALAEVLGALLETVGERIPGLLGSVFLLDSTQGRLRFVASPDLPEAYAMGLDGLEVGLDAGPFGTACGRRERVVVTDVAGDPTVQEYRDLLLKLGLASCCAQPIFDGHGRVLGLLVLHGRQPREATASEIEVIESAARLAELAIERRRAEQELRDSEEAVRALHAITSARDIGFDEQVRQLLALGCSRFGVEKGMLARVCGDGFEVRQAFVAAGGSPKTGTTLAATDFHCRETVESEHPVVRVSADPQVVGTREDGNRSPVAYLGVRVTVGERAWGTLAFFSMDAHGRRFSDAETDWLQLMARWIGSELDHAERRRDLELARFSVEHGSEAAFWLDPEGRVVHANEAACRLLDYSRDQLLSKSIDDVDVGCLAQRSWASLFEEVRQKGSLGFESSHKTRDGNVVPVELITNYLRFDDRDYVFAFAREIGKRKQTEKTLREATERYRVLFDQSPDAVVLVDPATGMPVEFNDVILGILGYERDEFARLPIHHHEVGSSAERVGRRSREMIDSGGDEFEMRLRTRAGDVRDMIVSVRPIELSGRTVLHGVLHDITERKSAERVLRESEERFSKAFKSSPLPVLISDLPDGRLIDVNDRFLALTGYSRDDVIGKTSAEIGLWDDLAERPKMLEDLLRHGSVRNLRVSYRTLRGEVRTALLNVELVDLGGRQCTLATAEDITERDQEAAERERLENLLQHSQKMEALGQLAGGVAHDFNNILTAILGNTEMLMREADEGASIQAVRMRGQLEQIRHAGERAAGLTRQLLAFSRKQVRELSVLAPDRVIGDMHGMMRRLIGEHIRLETRFDPETGRVMADEGQLEQLVLNLALNARDSMTGGGTLTIETSNLDLDDEAAAEIPGGEAGPYVRIRVSDTGCGISSEMLDHIFEPFFTTKPVGKGTGLGLATVYGIVSQAGGHLRVDSTPGQGTEVEVLIPRVEQREAPARIEPEPSELRGTETVLVCEDEDMVRDLACRILRSNGYRVLRAENGRRALELVRQCDETIDLLVTDTIMPEMSGTELAQVLEQTHPEMKVLFVSGYAPDVLAPHGVPGDHVELLAKPFSATALLERVRGVLDGGDDGAGAS